MDQNRLNSLDAFRGLAILCMVLSGSIAFGNVLPAWMFHAQTPPPYHAFKPEIPGITWVDLVFPFFLFTMGAAIPLALHKKAEEIPTYKLVFQLFSRLMLLAFFAIFTFHARAWVMAKETTSIHHILSILGFCLLFFMYGNWSKFVNKKIALAIKISSFAIGIAFLYGYSFAYGSFSLTKSDIIIIVLANMAFFGGLAWYFTRHQPILRVCILPVVMAIFLAAKETESINAVIFNWTPAVWLYKFYYLKYLFIIIPGTIAGEWLIKAMKESKPAISTEKNINCLIAILAIALVGINLWGLFTRSLPLNLLLTAVVCAVLVYLSVKHVKEKLTVNFIQAGAYLLILGLFFEAYEGGIKKDFSTYSYYFVCVGLSFFTLLFFILMEKLQFATAISSFLAANGKNPMIAYTAGNLFLIPLLKITSLSTYLDAMNSNVFLGFSRGVLFTGIVALITLFFTRIKFFWKT